MPSIRSSNPPNRRTLLWILLPLLGAGSCVAAFIGERQNLLFEETPGERGSAPLNWPGASTIKRSVERPTLLLFAHPFCSCTAATLDELETVLGGLAGEPPVIHVLFARPSSQPGKPGPTWERAAALFGATTAWDEGNREAQIFGARTSGLVLLYGPDGKLRFEGGVTGSRGHAGASFGSEALSRALLESGRPRKGFLVFGCSLGEFQR